MVVGHDKAVLAHEEATALGERLAILTHDDRYDSPIRSFGYRRDVFSGWGRLRLRCRDVKDEHQRKSDWHSAFHYNLRAFLSNMLAMPATGDSTFSIS